MNIERKVYKILYFSWYSTILDYGVCPEVWGLGTHK